MKINNAVLIKLGTPKKVKKILAKERVIALLKKKKRLPVSQIRAYLTLGGGYTEVLIRSMEKAGEIQIRWCECGQTKFIELP